MTNRFNARDRPTGMTLTTPWQRAIMSNTSSVPGLEPAPAQHRGTPLSRSQAVELLQRLAKATARQELPPHQAVGKVLARDAAGNAPVPEQAASLRDGYAVSVKDIQQARPENPVRLTVQGRLTADARHAEPLRPGHAVRVLTGAPLPPGADAVLPLEDLAQTADANAEAIVVSGPTEPGRFILPRGGDLPEASLLVRAGEQLSPSGAAMLTRARTPLVSVHACPRAVMFGLGSELAGPDLPDRADPDHIPADNTVLVPHLLQAWGADVMHAGILHDDLEATTRALQQAAENTTRPQLIVTTGGTGRSERDHARNAARNAGFEILFHGLDVRPGKNVFAAKRQDPQQPDIFLLGLPGPPPAVFAVLHALGLPLLRALSGRSPHPTQYAALSRNLRTRSGKEWLLACTLEQQGPLRTVQPLYGPQEPPLRALARAHAVAVLPPGKDLAAGDAVELLLP